MACVGMQKPEVLIHAEAVDTPHLVAHDRILHLEGRIQIANRFHFAAHIEAVDARGEEIDHGFPPDFAVGDDIHACHFLVHNHRPDGCIVRFGDIGRRELPLCTEIPDGAEPAGE